VSKILGRHRVEVDLEPDLPMLDLDMVLFEQVLCNLLDNAAKYSPPGSLIRIKGWRDRDSVRLQVIDEGEGIPPADLERIFDKFYRVRAADRGRAGTGLGLAICRGFVEAMHGTIAAGNRTDRPGAILTITLPVPVGAPMPAEAAA
jgi:two-component system sensor histidine kinase KdpD